jgi:acyl-CoA synthetase (AMP-forming)/AMP-acid ligase II
MRRGSAEPLIPCLERELRDVAGGDAERIKLADLGPELHFDEGAEPGEHGRGHQIAHYKIPRYIEFVAEFLMTITGKIQKFVMREQTIKKLGLKAEKTA